MPRGRRGFVPRKASDTRRRQPRSTRARRSGPSKKWIERRTKTENKDAKVHYAKVFGRVTACGRLKSEAKWTATLENVTCKVCRRQVK